MAFNKFAYLAALFSLAYSAKAIVVGPSYQMQSRNPKADPLGDLNLGTGNCWTAASNHNGAAVTLQKCEPPGTARQSWTFSAGVSIGGGTSAVGTIKIFGDKCLDVRDGLDRSGTRLQIWKCAKGNKNQKWQVTNDINDFNGIEAIQWVGSTKCVDLTGGKQSNGTPIQIWTCTSGNTNQEWISKYVSPTPISDGSQLRLHSFLQPGGSRELCLSAGDFDFGFNEDVVDMAFCDHFELGSFWLWKGGSLKDSNTNLCLSVTNNRNKKGTLLTTRTCINGDNTQQWKFNQDHSIQWDGTDKCIDLTDGNLDSGTKIQIWTCSKGNINQKWEIEPTFPN